MKKMYKAILLVIIFSFFNSLNAQFIQQGNKLAGTDVTKNAYQGVSVSISSDGNTAVMGGSGDNDYLGAAWVYIRENGVWSQQGNKIVGAGSVGKSSQGPVSISADGNRVILGGPGDNNGAGAAWIFVRKNGKWAQEGDKLIGADATKPAPDLPPVNQGSSVAISADGNTAIIGGPGDDQFQGAAWIFIRQNGVWNQQGNKLVVNSGQSFLGYSVALSADGNTAIIGAPFYNFNRGAAWIFIRQNGVWTQQGGKLSASDFSSSTLSDMGHSVSISADGNTAAIGGYSDDNGIGAAWIFVRQNGIWTQQGNKLVAAGASGHAEQGSSVSISADGNTVVIGGHSDNEGKGAAWIFRRQNEVWTQQGDKLVGTGTVGNLIYQGHSVSISGDGNTVLIGGPYDNNYQGASWIFVNSKQKINITGKVTSTATGKAVENAAVYLLNSDGTYVNGLEPVMTNSQGQYCFNNIPYSPSGYKVLLFEPLGYAVDENPKTVPEGLNPVVNFTITETISGNRSRDWNYWKNEMYLNMIKSESTRESIDNMVLYMKSIAEHYQKYFPSIFSDFNTLEQWYDVLNLSKTSSPEEIAKAELAAVLFNLSSLKVGQYFVATKDNKTAGDVLTYASELIRDKKKFPIAIMILSELNYRVAIQSDIVPEGNILYKFGGNEGAEMGATGPDEYNLYANYPNPFNPSTTIKYSLPADGHVSLKVYDISGKVVSILVDELQKKGTYEAQWNAENMASGIYFYRIQVNDYIKQSKMILLK